MEPNVKTSLVFAVDGVEREADLMDNGEWWIYRDEGGTLLLELVFKPVAPYAGMEIWRVHSSDATLPVATVDCWTDANGKKCAIAHLAPLQTLVPLGMGSELSMRDVLRAFVADWAFRNAAKDLARSALL